MSSNVGAGLCRVTIIAPRSRVDVALPVDVPLADLLPILLRHAGEDLPDVGLLHGGWALQRLGETPFDVSRNATALAIRDGEMLYLRPRQTQLPELAFDDVVDAIATASRDRSNRWQDSTTRRTGLVLAVVALVLAALVIIRSGPPWLAPSLVSGALAVGLVVAGAVLSRAFGDSGAGMVLGYTALPFAFGCGATVLGGSRSVLQFGAVHLLIGAAAVMVAAALAAFTVADNVPGLIGAALAALVATVAGVLDQTTGLTGPGTAALTVAFVLAVTPMIPVLAFRMADLPLPFIPLSAEDLRKDTYSVPGPAVLRKTLIADRFVTGMVGGTGALVMGCEFLLSREPTGSAPWLVALVATTVVLRARLFVGRLQRSWLLSAAAVGWALLALTVASQHSQAVRLVAVVVPLLIVAGSVLAAALQLPGKRVTPFWGRAGDIVEALLVIALLPVALAVLGLYGYVRSLSG